MCEPAGDHDDLSSAQPRDLKVMLFTKVSALEQLGAQQRGEIARRKGLKGSLRSNPGAWTRPPDRRSLVGARTGQDAATSAHVSTPTAVCCEPWSRRDSAVILDPVQIATEGAQ
jgi:hypothetical protein